MDVYKLIIERGNLGALDYANRIDKTNYKLASQIDRIIAKRLAQDVQMAPSNPFEGERFPTQDPAQQQQQVNAPTTPPAMQQIQNQENEQLKKDAKQMNNVVGTVILHLLELGYTAQSAIFVIKQCQLVKVSQLVENLNKLTPGMPAYGEAVDQLGKIIANLPNRNFGVIGSINISNATDGLRFNGLRDIVVNSISGTGSTGMSLYRPSGLLKPQAVTDVMHEAAGILEPISTTSSGLLHKPIVTTNFHPAIKDFDFKDIKNQINRKNVVRSARNKPLLNFEEIVKGKSPEEAIESLKSVGIDTTDLMDYASSAGEDASRSIIKTVSSPLEASLMEKIPLIGKYFSFLKPVIPMIMKFIGPLAVSMQIKEVISDYDEYGVDSKTVCDFLSAVAGVLEFIPGTQEITVPLSLAINAGCFLGGLAGLIKHDDTNKSSNKYKNISNADVEKRIADTKNPLDFNNLSPKDQNTIKTLYYTYSANIPTLETELNKAKNNGIFDNPLDAVSCVYKQIDQGGDVIPPAPATPPAATNPSTPPVTSFNLKKHLILA